MTLSFCQYYEIIIVLQYLLYNNHDGFDTLLISVLVVLEDDMKTHLIQTLRLTPKPSKTSLIDLHRRA